MKFILFTLISLSAIFAHTSNNATSLMMPQIQELALLPNTLHSNTLIAKITESYNIRLAYDSNYTGNYQLDTVFLYNKNIYLIESANIIDTSKISLSMPLYYSYNFITFQNIGIHKTYLITTKGDTLALSLINIIPKIITTPSFPIAGEPFKLQLIIGTSHSACPPFYENLNSEFDNSKNLILSYTEKLHDICTPIYIDPPTNYGPIFDSIVLDAGFINISIDSTMPFDSIMVYAPNIISGKVNFMKNPYTKSMIVPIDSALVIATYAPINNWNTFEVINYDTIKTVTDLNGDYTFTIPANKTYKISILGNKYYHEQTMFSSEYPTLESYPTQQNLNFELISTSLGELGIQDLVIKVTNNTTPITNASISAYAGREQMDYVLLASDTSTKTIQSAYGTTDSNGIILLKDLALIPCIDWVYTLSSYNNDGTYFGNISDLIRLNFFNADTIFLDLNKISAIDNSTSEIIEASLNVYPNPFNPSTNINFKGLSNIKTNLLIQIFDINGKLIKEIINSKTNNKEVNVTWNGKNAKGNIVSAGVYFLKAKYNNKTYSKRLFFIK